MSETTEPVVDFDFRLDGLVALVTGGASGIGAAIAAGLSAEGRQDRGGRPERIRRRWRGRGAARQSWVCLQRRGSRLRERRGRRGARRVRPHRHPGQQCGHCQTRTRRGPFTGGLGLDDRHQPQGHLPDVSGSRKAHARRRQWRHHQHGVAGRQRRPGHSTWPTARRSSASSASPRYWQPSGPPAACE